MSHLGNNRFLTTKQVAEYLGVSTASVRGWADQGELSVGSVTPGGHRRFLRNDVESFARSRAISTNTPAHARSQDATDTDYEQLSREYRQVREREILYSTICNATSDGIWDWNIASGEVFFSDRWIESLGYTRQQVTPTVDFWKSIVHPDDWDRVNKALKAHFDGKSDSYEVENRLRMASGQWRWNLDRGKVIERDEAGNPLRMVGVDIDISNLKGALEQAELERRKAKYYLKTAGVMIVALNSRGEVVLINPKGCEMLGASESEILGKNWIDHFLPERCKPEVAEVFNEVIRGEQPVLNFENPVLRADGTERIISWYNNPLLDDQGNVVGVLSSGSDITDLHTAEQSLSTLMGNLPGMAYRCLNDFPKWSMQLVSEGAERLTGYSKEELEHNRRITYGDLIFPEDREMVARMVQSSVEKGRHFEATYRICHADGSIRWVWERGKATGESGSGFAVLEGFINDITDRVEANQQLQESEQRFRTISALSPVGIFETSASGECTYVNEQAAEMVGVETPDCTGNGWLKQVHPEDRVELEQAWHYSCTQGEPFFGEYRFLHGDGREVWVIGQAVPVYNDQYAITGYIGTLVNITERKHYEQELLRSESMLNDAQHIARIGSFERDLSSRETVWSKELYQLLDFNPLDSVPSFMNMIRRVHKEDRSEFMQSLKQAFVDFKPVSSEFRYLRSDHSLRYFYARAEVRSDDEGIPRWIHGTVQDITELKLAEQAWLESEARFQSIFENAPLGMAMVDLAGYIVFCNGEFEKIVGYTRDELTEKTFVDITYPDDATKDMAHFESMLENRISNYSMEKRYIRKNGELVWVNLTVSAIRDIHGKPTYVIGMVQDITQKLLVEHALGESEKRFRAIFDQAAVGVAQIDSHSGRFIRINRKYCEILGVDSDAALGLNFMEVTHPDDLNQDLANMERMKSGEIRSFTMEKRYLRRDGDVVWVELTVSPMWEAGENPSTHIAVVENITERIEFREQLKERERRYRQLFTHNKAVELLIDPESGSIVDANLAAADYYGYSLDQLRGMSIGQINIQSREEIEQEMNLALEEQRSYFHFKHQIASGDVRDVEVHTGPIDTEQGRLLYSIIHDITDRVVAEERLKQTAVAFESSAEGIVITDPDTRILSVNRAFSEITGYSEQEMIGETPKKLASGRQDRHFYQQMWAQLNVTGQWQGEIWNRRKNGEVYPEWLTISAVKSPQDKVLNYVGVFADISLIKRSQDELNYLSHHDSLTDLPNRLLFTARLEHALEQSRRVSLKTAVILLDLDRFKNINDSLGHPVGDELLRSAALRLKEHVREVDTIARFGGDEFAVLMEQIEHTDDIAKVVEKLVRALDQPFVLEGHETIVTTSVGISVFPDDGSDVTTLLKNADAALYVAKEGGRNTYRYYRAEMTRDALNRLNIERELRLALETNQLEVWYQPQIDLESGEAVGAEALVRWRHPQRGIVPPNEFIPLAEETGLIVQLGEQVLKTACQQLHAWSGAGIFTGKVAVNVAGLQIERGDIVTSVQNVLQQTGLAPQLLELEITEGFIMRDAEYALRVLADLKQLGITTSIDDFGTGYSSLSYLKRIPIDNLKVDQSFVRDLPDDLEDAAITRAVIALAKSLGYNVIAEGVESEAQRAFLLQEQCSHAQGYLFARPMPADEFEHWLRRTRK